MLPDPLNITYDGNVVSLVRTSSEPDRSIFQSSDNQFILIITRYTQGDLGVQQTEYQLFKRTDDSTWTDGYNPQYISCSGGVGVNPFRLDESSRTKLKAAADTFFTAYSSRLVAGEL